MHLVAEVEKRVWKILVEVFEIMPLYECVHMADHKMEGK